jgi:hypothetical protein
MRSRTTVEADKYRCGTGCQPTLCVDSLYVYPLNTRDGARLGKGRTLGWWLVASV